MPCTDNLEEWEGDTKMFMIRFVFFCLFLIFLAGSCASTDETERAKKIIQENPHWDQAIAKKLAKYQIEPGMTKEMVTAALGKPTRKSMEEEEEVWEYYSYSYHPLAGFRIDIYLYIYFLNGVVIRTSYWEHV